MLIYLTVHALFGIILAELCYRRAIKLELKEFGAISWLAIFLLWPIMVPFALAMAFLASSRIK